MNTITIRFQFKPCLSLPLCVVFKYGALVPPIHYTFTIIIISIYICVLVGISRTEHARTNRG